MAGVTKPGNAAPTTTDANTPTPIGVPAGYYAEDPNPNIGWASNTYRGPQNTTATKYPTAVTAKNPTGQYLDGDEYGPMALDPSKMMDLQKKMESLHLYSGDYTLGVWQQQDAAAYAKVLTNSNINGVNSSTMLGQMLANPQVDTTPTQRAPLTVHLSNPEDIKALANKTAKDLYGGMLPDSTVSAITDAIHQSESQYQQSAYDMATTGGQVTDSISPDTVAANKIKELHPNEVAATRFGDQFGAMLDTFKSNQSGYQAQAGL